MEYEMIYDFYWEIDPETGNEVLKYEIIWELK